MAISVHPNMKQPLSNLVTPMKKEIIGSQKASKRSYNMNAQGWFVA